MNRSLEENLDLRLLRILHMPLTSCSVSRTAQLLALSQPSVSMSLKRLRDIFGDPLLVRSGAHMVMTERSAALLPAITRDVLSSTRRFKHWDVEASGRIA
jgi:DNA-binding transcriptional LysR family regulator